MAASDPNGFHQWLPKGEAVNIQAEIGKLLEDMNVSIWRADDSIKAMPK